jgi:hypothetical protein
VVVAVVACMLAACGTAAANTSRTASTANNDNTYGGLPSWLPKAKVPINRVQVATKKHFVLAEEGDTVQVVLPKGRARITLVGPAVPPFVAPPPPVTTATFTVTVSDASGTVPIQPSDFELVDGAGHFFHPSAFIAPGTSTVAPHGRTVSFRFSELMAVGAGSVRWSPDHHPMVIYDFTVEND